MENEVQTIDVIVNDGFVSIEKQLRERIAKGYKIVSVCPTSYETCSNGQFVKNAIVVLEEAKE